MEISDSGRLLALTTALGDSALSPVAFQAEEAISAPFTVIVEAVSQSPDIDPNQLLYKPATLRVGQHGTQRLFSGAVGTVNRAGMPQRGWYRYRLTIVPKLFFAGQTSDCRIFQQQKASDITQTICADAGQTISVSVSGSDPPLEYVTQYNETDLNFLARILEAAGFFYFFTHAEGSNTLVLTDQNQTFPASPKPTLTVVDQGDGSDTLSDWQHIGSTALGSVRQIDYDPANPSTLPSGQTNTTFTTAGASARDVVAWPARTTESGVATAQTKIAMEAAEAAVSLVRAQGGGATLIAGGRFTLWRDPGTGEENVDYVIQSIVHHGRDESWAGKGGQVDYGNSFTAFPVSIVWRQPVRQRRPVMAGIYAAIVLGLPGEEIHADTLGRIKVRLLWDHRADTVAAKAVWVRVMQPWGGNSWGWQHLPRVGTEVGVAFMDGDPDRPVVVGSFYNGNMALPFPVPAEQTKSGFRSRSTQHGGTSNFSELSIDDAIGSELFFVHAEKDMTREVENNDVLSVGNAQTITVAKGRQATVQQGGDTLTVSAGDLKIGVSTGSVSVEAAVAITLTVGGNSITIDQSGITVAGTMIKLQGQAMVQVQGPMVEANADGMLTLKGGVVMVN